jgi:hypothetical protein
MNSVLIYFYLDGALLYTGELPHVPDVGATVSMEGSEYAVMRVTWMLNMEPSYIKWVSVELVYAAITPAQAEVETQ